jgi:chromosome segregation ATPase
VNRFSPGYRQIHRVLTRLSLRCRLLFERRKLGRLETELGLLGWQQADFNEATEGEVRKLTDFERAQGRLTNDGAELGIAIRDLCERREKEKAEHDARKASFEANLSELEKPIDALERKLEAKRKALEEAEKTVADLEAELTELEAGDSDPAGAKNRFREVPNKLKNARAKLAGIREEVRGEESDLARNLPILEALEERMVEDQTKFDALDTELEKEITSRRRAKRKIEREINALEKAKSHPYREIGRALADNQIAPMNQPGALKAVYAQRIRIQTLESTIGASLEESRREPREALLNSWQWWFALLGLLVMLAILGAVVVKVMLIFFPRR